MALYAFDGTWQEDEFNDSKDTNVVKFKEAYQGTTCYVTGVGTKLGWLGKLLGGLSGIGGRTRIKEAMTQLKENFEKGDRVVDIVGFSRGAALALHFANEVKNYDSTAKIRFLGLWDVVASFGIPGNSLNIGWTLTLPDCVENCYHAMALDERRRNFVPTRVVVGADSTKSIDGRLLEVWFRGVHSDVGGGSDSPGLSHIALYWMLRRAKDRGLPVSDTALSQCKKQCDADAPISGNLDPIKNPLRQLKPTDLVHESVKARGASHNDPLPTMTIVYD